MKHFSYITIGIFSLIVLAIACEPHDELLGPISPSGTGGDCSLDSIPYNPQPYQFPTINGLPTMQTPANNPVTVAGVRLGRYLFYEKILSVDSSISCGSCHQQAKAFTDGKAKAEGVGGTIGTRSSMSLINIGYAWRPSNAHNFMWDGKFKDLEEQALAPVEHPLEMKNTWIEVERRLREHPHYPRLFREAFGITCKNEITKELTAKAIAQFERTLNSAASKYDSVEWMAFNYYSDAEGRGRDLYLGETGSGNKAAECIHCHNYSRNFATFARNNFSNNGIDSAASFADFVDKGYGNTTGNVTDNGRFREVTLRNIALTAPYMHDGRFATLEEVLDHYVSGGHPSPNVANELLTAPQLHTLTQSEKQDIIAFLNALTDTSYIYKPEWSDPFLLPDPWVQ